MRIDQWRRSSANRRGGSNYRLRLPRLKYAPECGMLCWTTTSNASQREGAMRLWVRPHPPHIYSVGIFCGALIRARRPSNAAPTVLFFPFFFPFSFIFLKPTYSQLRVPFCNKYPRARVYHAGWHRGSGRYKAFKSWTSAICYETRTMQRARWPPTFSCANSRHVYRDYLISQPRRTWVFPMWQMSRNINYILWYISSRIIVVLNCCIKLFYITSYIDWQNKLNPLYIYSHYSLFNKYSQC